MSRLNWAAVVLAAGALSSGCLQVAHCSAEAPQCPEGATCDVANGVCVVSDAGQSGDDASTDSGVDAGRDAGPSDASVDAGADAGFDAGQPFCGQSCAPWQWCAVDLDGGACQPIAFTVDEPTDASVRPMGAVNLKVRVTSGPDASVPWFNAEGTGSGSLQSGESTSVTLFGSSRVVQFIFGWRDGGATQTRDVTVDGDGPRLELVGAGGLHRRDETLEVLVAADESFDASVRLANVEMPAGGTCGGLSGSGKASRCYQLQLWRPELRAYQGQFAIEVSASDLVGNASSADASVSVTRDGGVAFPGGTVQVLAIAPNHELLMGTSLGLVRWLSDGGLGDAGQLGPVASVGVGKNANNQEEVVIAYTSASARIGAPDDTLCGQRCSVPNTRAVAGLALFQSNGHIGAVGSIDAQYCEVVPCGSSPQVQPALMNRYFAQPTTGAGGTFLAPNFVLQGTTAFFLGYDGGTELVTVSGAGTGSPANAGRFSLGTLASPQGLSLLADAGVLGTVRSGSGNDMFVMNDQGVVVASATPVGRTKGPVVVADRQTVWVSDFDSTSQLVAFNPLTVVAPRQVTPTASDGFWSPLLGAPNGNSYLIYSAGPNGSLSVVSSSGGIQWEAASLTPVVSTHPTLDRNCKAPGTGTGLLYIGTTAGTVHTVIVDSDGLLDTPDSWPKYQRSAGNAGNDDRQNFPTNWPCQ